MTSSFDSGSVGVLLGHARQIVSSLLNVRVHAAEVLSGGMMTFKCRVMTEAADDLIVRFYPPSRAALVHIEPDLLLRCHGAGLLVPQVISDSRNGPPSPLNYVVYRRIEGETLADQLPRFDTARRLRLASELARHLYELRGIAFEGAGEIISCQRARETSWLEFVDNALQMGLESIRAHKLLDDALIDAIDQVIQSGPPANGQARCRLVWGDINFGNIIARDDGSLAGLIDFEGCLSGDPAATLGYAAAVHGMDPFFTDLQNAWPADLSETDHDMVAWYALLRGMRLAVYAHLPLPTGRQRDPLIRIVPGITFALQRLLAGRSNN